MLTDDEGNFTIYDESKNSGAIISNKDPFIAMEKFKEATNLCLAVKTLLDFEIGMGDRNNIYIPEFN